MLHVYLFAYILLPAACHSCC